MALDPLKFQVAIIDEATTKLNSIEASLNSLKDKNITVTVNGLSDLQQLLSALQHQQVSNLGKDVGNAINEASRNLQKEAQDAVRTSLGNLAQDLASIKTAIQNDNFTAFSNRIQTCAEKVNLLDEAFKKFKVTIGEDKGLKDILAGLGAAIREASASMSAMNSVKNSGGAKAAQKDELKQQEEGLIRVANAMGRVRDIASGGGGASSGSVAFMESINKVGERNIQTLIKEHGHIERLIAIAKKSIDFGEGHPVLGMGRLRGDQMQNLQNLEQLKNIIKEILFAANQGDQSAIRFLNTLGSLKTVSFGKDLMGNNITLLGGHFDKLTHSVTGTATAMRQLNKDMRIDFNKVANKEKLAAEADAVKKLAASYKSMQQESKTMRSQSESALASRRKMLQEQAADLQKLLSFGKIGLGDGQFNSVREALREIRRELLQIETITQRGGNSTGLLRSLSVGRDYSGVIASGRAVADMRNKQAQETNLASRAVSQLTMEEQRLAQALNHATNSARGQSQVLSDLKSLATQYLGVWGAQSYLHKIIETGGQLEQQRLSLSAILGDVEKANTLFGQVKELAIKSPFGVVQIDQMTKQLAAYSFEYEELFDWTKRLADISAATGTEVSRLALALGHVRSEGALSGYTLRQFAMANVPVLRMLSENLGISTKEVRERVKKKEISADDVQEILKQLTDEGGMFYNAQETMSEALNAKYKNLRDAFDIMYGEIAEGGVGDALKEIAIILTQGAKEWERFGKDILMVAAAFGIGKAAIALYNTALGEGTAATLRSIAAAQQKENANLRLARAAGLVTQAEYEQLISNERYSASALKVALTTNKLTIEELQRAVALGKVNKTVAQAAVVAAGYDAALISNVRVLGMWRRGLFLLGEGFRAAKVAVKGFLASVWPLLALTAVFDLVNRASSQNDAAEEAAEGAAKATNKYQDLQAMTERLGNSQGKTNDQLESNIKAMKEALLAVGEYTDELRKQVDSVDSLAEKYNILHEAMKNVSEQASDRQSRKQALIEGGLSSGGGTAWNPLNWFRDNALQDAKDIDDYTKDLNLALDKNDKVLREGFRKILKTRGEWQEKFATMSAKDIFMSLSSKQQNDVLYSGRWGKNLSKAIQEASYEVANIFYGSETATSKDLSGYSYQGAINELRGHKEELAKAFEDAFRVDYPDIDLSNADDEQKIIFAKWLDTTIANLADVKEAGKKALNDIVIEGTITVRPKYSLDNENFVDFMNTFRKKNPLAYFEWQQHGRNASATEEEQRKSAESYGRTFSGATQSNIGNEAKKKIKELQAERKNLVAFQSSIVYKSNQEEKDRADERIKAIDEETKRLRQAQKDYNQYGDPDKSKGERKSEDKDARRLREIVRLYKDAYDWYGKYEKQVGEGSALEKVKEQFQPLFDEFRNQWKQSLSLDSIPEYKQNLETLLSEAQKLYESPKHKNSYMVEAIKTIRDAINNVDYEEAQRKMDEYASKVQIELDGLTRAWDMFNNVREATGNIDLAVQLSGADYQAGQTRNLADALREKIEQDFASANAVAIPFDINMSDKDIENKIKAAIPKESEERIKGIVEEYKKWRDLQRDVVKTDISTFAQLLGSAQDYETSVAKINNNLATQKEAIDAIEKPKDFKGTDEEWEKWKAIAKAIAEANAESDIFKLSSEYINLMNNSLAMTSKEIESAAQSVETELNRRLQAGTIKAQEFANEMEKVHKIVRDTKLNSFFGKNTAFTNFLNGGVNGAVNWLDKAINKRVVELGKSYTTGKDGKYNGTDQTLIDLLKKRTSWEKLQQSLKHVALAGEIVTGAFDGMVQATQSLSEMFDALGNEGAANTWSDISDAIKGISSVFKPVNNLISNAMNGNIGGIVSSAISAPVDILTGPITAFARLHDKALQREIERLREDVQKIENNTDLIVQARERTLGYDNGDLRRSYAQQYAPNEARRQSLQVFGEWFSNTRFGQGFDSDAQKSMYEYFQRNSTGTGYQQQLANLKAEREDYMRMYDAEYDKKKSSKEALEEYRKKIAEIDDQIRYFTEDLAKELWGIDLKGWANQISDSLWTAFENGEDAVKAFHETAKDIISDVAKRMMNIHLIEPAMAKLEEALFGKVGANGERIGGGAYNIQTGQFNERETLEILGNFFGEDGEFAKVIGSAESFYEMAKKVTGIDFGSNGSSSQKVIQGGFTEEETGLVLSYMNAIRADVSVNRAMIAQYFPMYYQALTSDNESLRGIENHTAAIMRSNEAIAKSNQAILDRIEGLRNKTWKVPMA